MGSSFLVKYESLINVHLLCDVIKGLVFEICYSRSLHKYDIASALETSPLPFIKKDCWGALAFLKSIESMCLISRCCRLIEFKTTVKQAKILSPLKNFYEETLTFEYRTDPLTGRKTAVIYGMLGYLRKFL